MTRKFIVSGEVFHIEEDFSDRFTSVLTFEADHSGQAADLFEEYWKDRSADSECPQFVPLHVEVGEES